MQATPQDEVLGYYQCQRCGHCCKWPGFVRLTREDMERIASYLQMEVAELVSVYTDLHPSRTHLMFKNRPDGSCIMYDEKNKVCRVHPVKPYQCTGFPNQWNFPGWEKICKAIFVEENENE